MGVLCAAVCMIRAQADFEIPSQYMYVINIMYRENIFKNHPVKSFYTLL